MTHKELQDLLPSYALNALDADEASVLEAHLAGCALCKQELASLREATAILAQGVKTVEPPRELEARILRAVRPSRPTWIAIPRSWAWGAGAAAAVILIAFAGVSLSLNQRVTVLREQVAAQDRILALLATPSARSVALTGSGEASVRLLYAPDRQEGILIAVNLGDPGPGFVYQLWLIAGQEPESAGVFYGTSDRRPVIVPVTADFTRYGVIAITRELGPLGANQPTAQPILAGKF